MSRHTYRTTNAAAEKMAVVVGYDRRLDYVFCTVSDSKGNYIYSNISDPDAGTTQQNVAYYMGVLQSLGIEVPESVFDAVEYDQLNNVGNSDVDHSQQE